MYVLGAQNNRLIETVLLSTHNICFGWEIRNLIFPKIVRIKLQIFSYPSVLTYVSGAQKNRLIETVLLSTHNICFGWEIRFFLYTILTKGLIL